MANPTTEHGTNPASQRPTPGVMTGSQSVPAGQSRNVPPPKVGQMGAAPGITGPQMPDTPGAEPILLTDLEPVYLVRLFPQAFAEGGGDPRGMAMEAGAAAREAGLHLLAAQQEPPLVFDAEGRTVPPPPDAPPPSPLNWAAPIPRRASDPVPPAEPPQPVPTPPPPPAQPHPHPEPEHKGNDHPRREA